MSPNMQLMIHIHYSLSYALVEHNSKPSNPKKVLLKLFDLFIKKGGHFEKQNVQSISFTSNDKSVIKTDLNFYNFDKIVVACGAFSKKITD